MSSPIEVSKLPDCILSENSLVYHTFDDLETLVREQMGSGMTLSSLCKRIIQHRLEQKNLLEENRRRLNANSSLTSISGAKILDELSNSANIESDLKAIAETLTETTFRQLLRDPRAPYHVLRAFHAIPQSYVDKEAAVTGRRAVDIDEAVLENDRYIRFRGGLANTDGKYLVGLKTFAGFNSSAISDPTKTLAIMRECPPKGGIELLDKYRQRTLRIQQNDHAYIKNFDKITEGCLRGLQWDNLLVAGSVALQALLDMDHTAYAYDGDGPNSYIGIFLHGLNATQANCKLRQIENLWKRNLDPNAEACVLRTESVVEFRVNRPYKSVHVALTMFQSPTEILSHFHLDAYAIGYDGRQVLMMPRCARAIETGYSILTRDLMMPHHLYHHLGIVSSGIMKDLFEHADLGFGIRILPCYVKSLQDSALKGTSSVVVENGVAGNSSPAFLSKPAQAREPGLKTLRRILLRAHSSTFNRCSCDNYKSIHDSHSFGSFAKNCELWRVYSRPFDAATICLMNNSEVNVRSQRYCERMFNVLRHVIAREVGQDLGAIPAYRHYLTRRIRVAPCEENLAAALNRQISVPFIIPLDLEHYILHDIPQQHSDLPHLSMRFPLIIPVHDPTKYTQYTDSLLQENQHDPIPSLAENADERGNLRYRIISQDNIWAGQHPVLDEIAILLRFLCQWFNQATSIRSFNTLPKDFHTGSESAISHLSWSYRSLQLFAMGKANGELPYSSESMRARRPALTREYEIFRQWVKQLDEEEGDEEDENRDGISSQQHLATCPRTERDQGERDGEGAPPCLPLWAKGDEGEWDEEGAPPWTKWD